MGIKGKGNSKFYYMYFLDFRLSERVLIVAVITRTIIKNTETKRLIALQVRRDLPKA